MLGRVLILLSASLLSCSQDENQSKNTASGNQSDIASEDKPNALSQVLQAGPSEMLALNKSSARFLNLKEQGAIGDGVSRKVTEVIRSQRGWPASYVGMELDTTVLIETMKMAQPGDTVVIPAGTYLISSGAWGLKSGVSILGFGAHLKAPVEPRLIVLFSATDKLSLEQVTFEGIRFENIGFQFDSYKNPGAVKKIRFNNATFINGNSNDPKFTSAVPAHINFYVGSDLEVNNCKFIRTDNKFGRSVVVHGSDMVRITNNEFSGYLVSATTVGGATISGSRRTSSNIFILGNKITRTPGDYFEDHGIYVHEMTRLNISNNEISGWSQTSAGGAIKVRNGDFVTIRNNRLQDSGILLYAYTADTPNVPLFFRNAVIDHNFIDMRPRPGIALLPGSDPFAISYYRNFQGDALTESNIAIEFNDIKYGAIYIHSTSVGSAFRVNQNRGPKFLLNATGIKNVGNTVLP